MSKHFIDNDTRTGIAYLKEDRQTEVFLQSVPIEEQKNIDSFHNMMTGFANVIFADWPIIFRPRLCCSKFSTWPVRRIGTCQMSVFD